VEAQKNVTLHQICMKSEWIHRAEWILQQVVNEAIGKKQVNISASMESLVGATRGLSISCKKSKAHGRTRRRTSGGKSETCSKQGSRKTKDRTRQQQKHKKNIALHQICMKSEQVHHQEWILQQGVNEAAAKKENKKKGERPRVVTLDGKGTEGKDRAGTVAPAPST
jgi:hypothetical protein